MTNSYNEAYAKRDWDILRPYERRILLIISGISTKNINKDWECFTAKQQSIMANKYVSFFNPIWKIGM